MLVNEQEKRQKSRKDGRGREIEVKRRVEC